MESVYAASHENVCENVFANLEPTPPIHLTELEDTEDHVTWCCGSRSGRNLLRVSVAGALSAFGTWYGGFVPVTAGIIIGGVLNGIGNGVSTYLSKETKRKHLMEMRLTSDFPKVAKKVDHMSERISRLSEIVDLSKMEEEQDLLPKQNDMVPESCAENDKTSFMCVYDPRRHLYNLGRIMLAGSLPGAGVLLAGFVPTTFGIIGAGALAGLGNGLSTWLTYEQTHDFLVRRIALDKLPKLLKDVEESEKKIIAVVRRIETLNPQLIMNYSFQCFSKPHITDEEDEDAFLKRLTYNWSYVIIAGLMSLAGAEISGFYSKTPGIVIGAIFSAAANSISTRLSWENKNDKRMEGIALNDFPERVQKIIEVYAKLNGLERYVRRLEEENSLSIVSLVSSNIG